MGCRRQRREMLRAAKWLTYAATRRDKYAESSYRSALGDYPIPATVEDAAQLAHVDPVVALLAETLLRGGLRSSLTRVAAPCTQEHFNPEQHSRKRKPKAS